MSVTARLQFLDKIDTCIIPAKLKRTEIVNIQRLLKYSLGIVEQDPDSISGEKTIVCVIRQVLKEGLSQIDPLACVVNDELLLNNAAVTIQKHWKGYLARIYYREYLLGYFQKLCLTQFNSMATKIQKMWRGYQSRKKKFNFHRRKAYLKTLVEKNELILSQLEEMAEQLKDQQLKVASHKHQQFQISQACKEHHLISTKVIPGIYNSPYRNRDNMESFLRSMDINNTKPPEIGNFPESHRMSLLSPIRDLPPVLQKPQGPFRDPKDVQRQRYKPFRPTLRVETDFEHLEKARKEMKDEEWTQRVHDDHFLPVRSVQPKYEPLLYTQSPYRQFAYGNSYFRETNPRLQVSKKDFKSCVPSISLFADVNMTY